jgi:hypothetical protein
VADTRKVQDHVRRRWWAPAEPFREALSEVKKLLLRMEGTPGKNGYLLHMMMDLHAWMLRFRDADNETDVMEACNRAAQRFPLREVRV